MKVAGCGLAAALLWPAGMGWAEPAKRVVPIAERAVDMVSLVDGQRLLGMVTGPPSEGNLRVIVGRQWLNDHVRELYRQVVAGEQDRRREALEQLRDRIRQWQARRPEPEVLAAFLQQSLAETQRQIDELRAAPAAEEATQLVVIEVPPRRVRRWQLQPPAARRILALAWEHRLAKVEDQSAVSLARALADLDVDVDQAQPDLSDRIPLGLQSDRQWAGKVALTEYSILGKPHYKGTGSLLVRDDAESERPGLADLLGGLLNDQLGELVGLEPDGRSKPAGAIETATKSAAADGSTGLRITQLDQDLAQNRVTVSGWFLALMPDGGWQEIWHHTATADTTRPRPEAEKAIAEDPQIAAALKQLGQLGLGGAGGAVARALRHGAATQEAAQAVDREFSHFLLRSTRQLAGPPVWVPDAGTSALR